MSIKPLIKGLASYIPGSFKLATGGTISARYCYSVWLRHLIKAHDNRLPTRPLTIAELGPGDSLGIGLAALISGVDKYYAFDIARFANHSRNMDIFDELVLLFQRHENVPDKNEFPEVKPYLGSYEFPSSVLTDERLNECLKPRRLEAIKKALTDPAKSSATTNEIQIFYFVPWYYSSVIKERSVDMVYSQAVLEHVDDLPQTYHTLYRWLKPGGFMSHQIDFKCHGTSSEWNGHWTYSDLAWRIIKGNKPYLLNRQPHSSHINLMGKYNFEIICDIKIKDSTGISRDHLAAKFKSLSEDDLTTSGAFIQAIKRE